MSNLAINSYSYLAASGRRRKSIDRDIELSRKELGTRIDAPKRIKPLIEIYLQKESFAVSYNRASINNDAPGVVEERQRLAQVTADAFDKIVTEAKRAYIRSGFLIKKIAPDVEANKIRDPQKRELKREELKQAEKSGELIGNNAYFTMKNLVKVNFNAFTHAASFSFGDEWFEEKFARAVVKN